MGHLKLKDGTTFPLNLSVGDIRDISKRSGAFSKTVTLVGDDENNNLLNHYYDVNIVAGTFDINKLQQCQVIQNGIVILDNAYMQLVEVVKSQTTDAHNQQIEYKVLVKDSVSDFFTKLGNKTLNDINMNEIILGTSTLDYTSANVVSSFSNTIADGYKYVMPYDIATNSDYNLRAFHPALYAKTYFDAIFQGAGFTYEWGNQSPFVDTTNDNFFEKLVIPYNGGTPQIDREDYLVEATKASLTTTQSGLSWTEQVTGFTEVTDGQSIFDPVNGDYAVPLWVQNPENIQVQVTIDFDVDLFNNGGSVANRVGSGSSFIRARAEEQGGGSIGFASIYEFSLPSTVAVGSVSVVSGQTATVTFSVTNLDNTDILELYLQSAIIGGVSYDQTVDIDVTVNSSTWKIIPSADTVGYQSEVDLNIYVPKQIKQSDFIKSIFMMYNLYAEVDSSQPNKLILQSRDDYYDSGSEIDWTYKLAKDRDQTLQFLPELSAKKMVVSYKDDDDDPNTVYKQATNETYGQIEYTFENEYVKGVDRKELIFSPTPIATTDLGAIVPLLGYIPETNIRILVDGGTQTCASYTIIDYFNGGTGVGTTTTTAPLITHFDDPITPTFDLNFGTCDYYFYSELATKTNNTLYNLYWRRTLGQIDKGKMLTAYFDLTEVDIQSLNLNDKIRIDNSWWNINRVIDYDANERKLTKVELISLDEEVEFTEFAVSSSIPIKPNRPTRPVRPIRPTRPETTRPIKNIIEINRLAKNLSYPSQDSLIMGTNNVIQPDVKRAIVLGDNQTIDEEGIHTDKLFIDGIETTGNLSNIDLAQTDKVRTYNMPDPTGNFLEFTNSDDNNIILFESDGITINNDAQDHDVRIEGQSDANLFFIDASTDRVGIGTNTPSYKLDVNGDGRFDSGIIINDGANNSDTRIEGQTDANLFFIDASTDRVGIGTNTPIAKLDITTATASLNLKSTAGASNLLVDASTGNDAQILLYENGTLKWSIFNDASTGNDFRIRNNTAGVNSIFIDGTTNYVGIGTNTPNQKLHTYTSGVSNFLKIESGATDAVGFQLLNTSHSYLTFINGASGDLLYRSTTTGNDYIVVENNASDWALRFTSAAVVVNELANNTDFRVEGLTDTNLFFTDASQNRVGVGTNAPSYKLDVNGDVNVASGSAYYHNGTAGLSGTYTFGGGSTGDIASMTFNGGILTAVTTVP